MSSDGPTDSHLEIAHAPLIDIVAYSKLLIDQQTELVREPKKKVHNTKSFGRRMRLEIAEAKRTPLGA